MENCVWLVLKSRHYPLSQNVNQDNKSVEQNSHSTWFVSLLKANLMYFGAAVQYRNQWSYRTQLWWNRLERSVTHEHAVSRHCKYNPFLWTLTQAPGLSPHFICVQADVSDEYYAQLELLLLDVTSPVCGQFTVPNLPSGQWDHTMLQKHDSKRDRW